MTRDRFGKIYGLVNYHFNPSTLVQESLMALSMFIPIGLHHPLDGVTNTEYKLLCFIQLTIFCKEEKALAFNWDRCCHLALCLRLILFHCIVYNMLPEDLAEV
jgi:hypothetical protein